MYLLPHNHDWELFHCLNENKIRSDLVVRYLAILSTWSNAVKHFCGHVNLFRNCQVS